MSTLPDEESDDYDYWRKVDDAIDAAKYEDFTRSLDEIERKEQAGLEGWPQISSRDTDDSPADMP